MKYVFSVIAGLVIGIIVISLVAIIEDSLYFFPDNFDSVIKKH